MATRATIIRAAAASTCLFVISVLPFLSPSPSVASATPGVKPFPAVGPCDMPTTRDLIVWERRPRLIDSAFEVGDADLSQCKPTVDTWPAGEPTGPGYCSKIAWASDNPGYDTDARPAPPLKKVIEAVGDC
ncbi:hypothetical protein MOKP64_49240 [Mycobacterium avium subsp. hominissuis]